MQKPLALLGTRINVTMDHDTIITTIEDATTTPEGVAIVGISKCVTIITTTGTTNLNDNSNMKHFH